MSSPPHPFRNLKLKKNESKENILYCSHDRTFTKRENKICLFGGKKTMRNKNTNIPTLNHSPKLGFWRAFQTDGLQPRSEPGEGTQGSR